MELVNKTFSELTTEELYQLLELRSWVFVVEQQCIYQDCDGADRHARQIFLRDGDRIAASLRLLEPGCTFETAAIGRVVTAPEYRGRGLIRLLLTEALRFAREDLGEKRLRLAAQCYLEKFYEDLGFAPISQPYVEDGIPHIDMEILF